MMRSLSGDSKANIDKILEEFRNAKKVEYVTKKISSHLKGPMVLIPDQHVPHYLPFIPHVSIYQEIIYTDHIDN